MKLFFTTAIFPLLIAIAGSVQTKKIAISGKVISFEESLPLQGAQIEADGSGTIVSTTANGKFTIQIASDARLLTIKLDGYERQEVKLTGAHEYNIVLQRKSTVLFNNKTISYSIYKRDDPDFLGYFHPEFSIE